MVYLGSVLASDGASGLILPCRPGGSSAYTRHALSRRSCIVCTSLGYASTNQRGGMYFRRAAC
eukprot:1144937-Pyramimonas_sp.AAC.1